MTENQKEYQKRVKQLKKQIKEYERLGYRGQDQNKLDLLNMPKKVTKTALEKINNLKVTDVYASGYLELPTGEKLPVSKIKEAGLTRENIREFLRKKDDISKLSDKDTDKLIQASNKAAFYSKYGSNKTAPKTIDYNNAEKSIKEKLEETRDNISKSWDEVLQYWDGIGVPPYGIPPFTNFLDLIKEYGIDDINKYRDENGKIGVDLDEEVIKDAQERVKSNIDATLKALESISETSGISDFNAILDNPSLRLLEEVLEQSKIAVNSTVSGMVEDMITNSMAAGVPVNVIADVIADSDFATGEGFSAFYDDTESTLSLADLAEAMREATMRELDEIPFYIYDMYEGINEYLDNAGLDID